MKLTVAADRRTRSENRKSQSTRSQHEWTGHRTHEGSYWGVAICVCVGASDCGGRCVWVYRHAFPPAVCRTTSCPGRMSWRQFAMIMSIDQVFVLGEASPLCIFRYLTFYSLPVTWCTNSLTFNNCTFCPHCIYVFCIYLGKKQRLVPLTA